MVLIVPDEIYKYCRPNSTLPKELVQTKSLISKSKAKNFHYTPTLFEDYNQELQEVENEAKMKLKHITMMHSFMIN
jgi:hypothetical protein